MPIATFARVRDVSSEDKQHIAENIIKPQPGKTWKTCNVGEKLAYIVLEMDEAKKITGIDIGNEHSAFVEVLVGNSSCSPSDFKEILLTCSFMTPIESRNSNNANRVRCFNEAVLVPTTAEKKWSLVKVICTQPFNKHVQYGLSFLKVHVALNSLAVNNQNKVSLCSENFNRNVLQIGKFKLRENSTDSENEGASNLFNRWKKSKDEKDQQSTSLRFASNVSLAEAKNPSTGINTTIDRQENHQILDRNRDAVMFGGKEEDIDASKELSFAKKIEIDKQRRLSDLQRKSKEVISPKNSKEIRSIEVKDTNKNPENVKAKAKRNNDNPEHVKAKGSLTQPSEAISVESAKKRHSSPPAERQSKKVKSSNIQYKPFNKLLEGVVLVISGIQNPDRCDLRNKALSLGAKYKGDWDNSCTHLICAFKNTPKYNQVKGKGKIITRSWIEKCHSSRKYLPWRRYALESQEMAKHESDEEIHDESLKPQESIENSHQLGRNNNYENRTLSLCDTTGKNVLQTTSDSDTDDELERVKTQNKKIKNESLQKPPENNTENLKKNVKKELYPNSTDVFELSTDEEDYLHDKRIQSNAIKNKNN